jgi:hypothetical protein
MIIISKEAEVLSTINIHLAEDSKFFLSNSNFKWPGHKADHSPPSSAKVKNV